MSLAEPPRGLRRNPSRSGRNATPCSPLRVFLLAPYALQDFPGSMMGRDLTTARCTFNGKPLLLITSHLESEKTSSAERKAQFSQVGEMPHV